MTAHWGMPDPAAVPGTDEVRQQAFRDAAVALKRRLELLMALPLQSLDSMAIHRQVKEIGKR
jgi:arsenate reductase